MYEFAQVTRNLSAALENQQSLHVFVNSLYHFLAPAVRLPVCVWWTNHVSTQIPIRPVM